MIHTQRESLCPPAKTPSDCRPFCCRIPCGTKQDTQAAKKAWFQPTTSSSGAKWPWTLCRKHLFVFLATLALVQCHFSRYFALEGFRVILPTAVLLMVTFASSSNSSQSLNAWLLNHLSKSVEHETKWCRCNLCKLTVKCRDEKNYRYHRTRYHIWWPSEYPSRCCLSESILMRCVDLHLT